MSRTGTTGDRGDSARFEQLFRETRVDVLAYLSRRAGAADAADLLAEVYLVAWRRRADLPRGRERLWLFGAARRLLAQHRRLQAGSEHLRLPLADHPEEQRGQDSSPPPGSSSAAQTVQTALEALPEVDRELITLTAWERLSTADAARVVGMTATTARVRLHRARRRLAAHPDLRRLVAEPPEPSGRAARPAGSPGAVSSPTAPVSVDVP